MQGIFWIISGSFLALQWKVGKICKKIKGDNFSILYQMVGIPWLLWTKPLPATPAAKSCSWGVATRSSHGRRTSFARHGQHLVPAGGCHGCEAITSGEGLQHHEAAEVLEGIIGDVPNLVESQGHGLQRWQVVQSLDRDLRQSVIIQPQVTQGEQPLKALLGHHRDKVCIQASEWERNRVGISERQI